MAENTGSTGQASGEPVNAPADGGQQPSSNEPATNEGGQPTSVLNNGIPSGDAPSGNAPSEGEQPSEPKSGVLDLITDENLKKDPNLQHIKSVDDLAKSYTHAQSLVGKDKIPVPSNEDDAAWNDVLSKLGRPDTPEGYELPKPAEDSNIQLPEGMDQAYAKKAHELGLTNKQARDLFGWYIEDVAEPEFSQVTERLQNQAKEAETQLRKEFGNAVDDKVADAQRAVRTYGGDEMLSKLAQTGLGNDPEVVKMFAKLGSSLREDTVGGSSAPAGRTPDQAQAEISQKMADPAFRQTYFNGSQPGHDEAVQQIQRLYKDAYPNAT